MHGARNVGGGEYSIYLLIKNLRRDIFEPIVFFSNENEIIKRLGEDGIRLINITLNKKITSVYRDKIKINPVNLFIYFFYLTTGIFQVLTLLKKNKIDLLHPHDNLSKIIGGFAAKLCNIKVVTHCRDDLKNDFISKVFRLVYRFLTDRIIAVSEKTKKSLTVGKKSLLKKTTVIYNGVDLSVFNPYRLNDFSKDKLNLNNLNNKIVIGVIAVLEKYKGHIYLFHAIEQLKQNGVVNFICLVIGDGRGKSNLIKYIKNENLEELILFLGHRKDIPELLKITDILIIPSIEQEAFPRVAIEAMAMEVPVVCTNFGGLPEAVVDGETGIVVPCEDADNLYKAIKYLIESPEVRKKMGECGRKRVKGKFNVNNNVRMTERLYLDVLKDYKKAI